MGEEAAMSPQELMLQKKKARIDRDDACQGRDDKDLSTAEGR